ncbi:hypothetical protein F2Q70_00018548 [Brassica cretica]|uniref:Uncharacterized protein n=1 Tax=Brassica cretica TaxID=69181 RepID=A0A8S9I5N7_BRACR|nr:hypothetical protein F2Q70_00018548 [Brassica cretica]
MLAQLRRDYAKKVSLYRKDYVHEIEMLRVEKQRKDEARLVAERAANEERRRLKAEAAKVRAEERKFFEKEFRRTLMKERGEKLEFWRMTGLKREEKKKDKKKLLHEQSSLWIEPKELEKKIMEALRFYSEFVHIEMVRDLRTRVSDSPRVSSNFIRVNQNQYNMGFCNKLSRLVRHQSETTSSIITSLRSFSSEAATHHRYHQETHSFLEPERYINSWEPPKDPRDAERMLAQLRRDYAKKVSLYRKDYVHEIEMLRAEKQRKDEARLVAERAANEERRRLKAEAAKVRAEERKVFEEEFRRTLGIFASYASGVLFNRRMKEREEKLEFWRMTGQKREEKKKDKKKLLHEQSSLWIEPKELEKKITEALVESTTL